MKRLLTMLVVFTMLAVCAPSNAYILVYRLTSTVKTVETEANSMMKVKVKGYLALDIDDVEETADDTQLVIYGIDGDANKVYYQDNVSVEWTEEGAYLTVDITDHRDIFYFDLRLIGKIKAKDVGFGSEDPRSAASSVKGSMFSTHGSLFDQSQTLFGSGTASMTLDIKKTKAANIASSTVEDVITEIVEGDGGLVEKGYEELIIL